VQNGMRVDQRLSPDDFGLVVANPTEKIKRRILL